jgi:hypothetical protein
MSRWKTSAAMPFPRLRSERSVVSSNAVLKGIESVSKAYDVEVFSNPRFAQLRRRTPTGAELRHARAKPGIGNQNMREACTKYLLRILDGFLSALLGEYSMTVGCKRSGAPGGHGTLTSRVVPVRLVALQPAHRNIISLSSLDESAESVEAYSRHAPPRFARWCYRAPTSTG